MSVSITLHKVEFHDFLDTIDLFFIIIDNSYKNKKTIKNTRKEGWNREDWAFIEVESEYTKPTLSSPEIYE